MNTFIELLEAKSFKDQYKLFRSDLKKMTKIYNNIKTSKDAEEGKSLFVNFREKLEKWVYEDLLNQSANRNEMDHTETWYEKAMRQDMWGAVSALSDLWPEDNGYNYETDTFNYTIDLLELIRNRKKTVRTYQAKFRIGFASIEQFFEYRESDHKIQIADGGNWPDLQTEPKFDSDIEQISVGTANLIIHNEGRNISNESREQSLRDYINIVIPKSLKILKKRGFNKLIQKLTLHYRFTIDNNGASGDYDIATDNINIFPWGNRTSIDEAIGVLIHEIGHQFYYKHLTKKAQEWWETVMWDKIVRVTDKKIDEFATKYILNQKTFSQFIKTKDKARHDYILKRETEPENLAVFSYLAGRGTFKKEPDEIVKFLHRVAPGIQSLPEYVSDYGATKPSEAFAEVFRYYLTRGARRLGPWTRTFFRSVVNTSGIKLKESTKENTSFKDFLENKLK